MLKTVRHVIIALVLPAALLSAFAVAAPPAMADTYLGQLQTGYVNAEGQRLCLDDSGYPGRQSLTAGNPMQIWTCKGTPNQIWYAHYMRTTDGVPELEIRNEWSNQCLDARNHGRRNGTVVQQWPCQAGVSVNQLWYAGVKPSELSFMGFVPISNASTLGVSGPVLDVRNSSPKNGTPIQLWQYKGSDDGPDLNQIWSWLG